MRGPRRDCGLTLRFARHSAACARDTHYACVRHPQPNANTIRKRNSNLNVDPNVDADAHRDSYAHCLAQCDAYAHTYNNASSGRCDTADNRRKSGNDCRRAQSDWLWLDAFGNISVLGRNSIFARGAMTTRKNSKSGTKLKKENLRLEWWDAKTLERKQPNPLNWREHPEFQSLALDALIFGDEGVGWAGAALFNERTGRFIDGHDRRKLTIARGDIMPVLVGAWSDEQERKILATLDPITALAQTNGERLQKVLEGLSGSDEHVKQLLNDLAQQAREALAQLPENVQFPEYDKDTANDVKYAECPKCGHKFPL